MKSTTINNPGRAFPDAIDGTSRSFNERNINKQTKKAMTMKKDNDAVVDAEYVNDQDDEISNIPAAKQGKKLNSAIRAAANKVLALQQDRKAIQADIQSIIEDLESKGILRDSFKDTLKKMSWSKAKRDSYNLGVSISGNAVGIMEQTELALVK